MRSLFNVSDPFEKSHILTKPHRIKYLLFLMPCLAMLALTIGAAPAGLDPTFGTLGRVVNNPDGSDGTSGNMMALQPDGKTDFVVYRPSNGGWYILRSGEQNYTILAFGIAEDKPVAADFDGDGKADVAVFRPSDGTWYLLRTTSGFGALQWGLGTDIPTENAFLP